MKDKVLEYVRFFNEELKENKGQWLAGDVYFYGDDIIALPRDNGDCRYPYGEDGFNYWTYASGYIHCNEGLFSPFLRVSEGGEPKISFFVGHKVGDLVTDRFSVLSVPVLDGEPVSLSRFSVFSKNGTYYITETDKLISCVRTFVKDKQIYYSFLVINQLDEAQEIYTSSCFNPFLKNSLVENSTDRWFRQIEFTKSESLGTFKLETYEEKDRGIMATNFGLIKAAAAGDYNSSIINHSATTSRYEYVGGSRSSLHTASVLNSGKLSNTKYQTSFTETAICGDLIDIHLDDYYCVDYVLSYTNDEEVFKLDSEKCLDENEVNNIYDSLNDKYNVLTADYLQVVSKEVPLSFKFEDSNIDNVLDEHSFNPFMKHLKKQVEFCSEIKGFIQLSHFSLIGIRDVFQAIEAYMFDQPEKAKHKMLEALSFISPTGQLPRQYSLPKSEGAIPAMDLRPFIDQGVWVISTILTYVRLTKDYSFLMEECGYYDIVDEHKHIVAKSELKDSVLDHMFKIMDYLLDNRDLELTNCVKALYGDWNDALDGLGKSLDPSKEYGSGVSVMASLQVYQNLNEMIELINNDIVVETYCNNTKGNDLQSIKKLELTYLKSREELKNGLLDHAIDNDRLIHGWGDKKSYLVGSNNDPDNQSRDGLTSNAFWILSGLIKEDDLRLRKEMILNAYKRLDSKYGMKTFEPYFKKGTTGVGRIPNLPKGTAENGATYIHASMFAVMSLFAIGEPQLAWEELLKLIPLTHESVSVSPFVVPNSYGYNEDFGIDGESMQDWQTGSSNVMLKTMIRFVMGFEPAAEGIFIQPSMYQVFNHQQMSISYLGKKLTIEHRTRNKMDVESRKFSINGKEFEGSYDEVMDMKRLYLSDYMLKTIKGDIHILIED